MVDFAKLAKELSERKTKLEASYECLKCGESHRYVLVLPEHMLGDGHWQHNMRWCKGGLRLLARIIVPCDGEGEPQHAP